MRKLISIPSVAAYLSKAVVLSALSGAVLLSGCAVGDLAPASNPVNPVSGIEISGTVHGGATAISGATISLWVSGTTGYGKGATLIGQSAAPTAISTGAFTITPTFSTSSCTSPSSQIVYLTISGGDPTGNTLTANNHAILMADVLGVCSNLTSSVKVSINEATTVAAAYALRGFTAVTSAPGGFASLTIGAPTTNTQGLLDAAANAVLLVNPNTGYPNPSTATVLLPQNMVNSLANSTTSCVNTTEYNTGGCTSFLSLTTPPSGSAPSNIFQALLNIAAYPGQNVSSILNLGTGFSLFQPTVPTTTVSGTTGPNDLTLAIAYPNSTLNAATAGPVALTIDTSDNIWVLGANNGTSNYVTELSNANTGSVYTNNTPSSLASTQNVRWGAFDTSSNLWLSDGAALAVYNGGTTTPTAQSFSTLTTGSTAATPATLDANNYVLAIDGSGNVFTASYGAAGNCVPNTVSAATTVCDAVELTKSGSTYTPNDVFGGSYIGTPTVRGIFADANTNSSASASKGNVWFTDYGVLSATKGATTTPGNTVQILTPSTGAVQGSTISASTGTLTTGGGITVGPSGAGLWGVALDNTSSAYVVASTIPGLYYVSPSGSSVTSAGSITFTGIPTATSAPSAATVTAVNGGLSTPANVAIDGLGNVFISNTAPGTVVQYSPALGGYVSPYFGFSPSISVPTQTATASKYKVASGVLTVTANNTFTPGTAVTLAGFPSASGLNGQVVTVLASGLSGLAFTANTTAATAPSTTVTGATAISAASNQALITCTPAGTPTTCSVTGQAVYSGNGIAIDRAGSVWTLSTSGTLQAIIGTASPTNPVAAAGQYGVQP